MIFVSNSQPLCYSSGAVDHALHHLTDNKTLQSGNLCKEAWARNVKQHIWLLRFSTFRLLLLPSQNSVGLGKQILQQFDCLLTNHSCTLLGLGLYLTDCTLKLAYLWREIMDCFCTFLVPWIGTYRLLLVIDWFPMYWAKYSDIKAQASIEP